MDDAGEQVDCALEDSSDRPVDLLIFRLGDRHYGLRLSEVRQLLRAVTVEPLPRAPEFIEGIINVRGTLVPVLDLRHRFGLPPKAAEVSDHMILGFSGTRAVALRVDLTDELRRVEATQIEDVDQVAVKARYLSGVAMLPDGLIVIHDLASFLSQAEAEALDAALDGLEGDGFRQ